jgi:hypothetical protein
MSSCVQNKRAEQMEKRAIQEYSHQLKQFVVTSRFNQQTWLENQGFREKNHKIGCIYCTPVPVTSAVPVDMPIFVLEMNNDTNRIMGVGMVKNHPYMNAFDVYDNGNYNRYQYVGKRRVDRADMTAEQETIMRVFDVLCFKGNRHQKRGHGLKLFPLDMLYRCSKILDLVGFLRELFVLKVPDDGHFTPLKI